MNPIRKIATRHKGSREHDLQTACVRWFRLQYPKFRENLFAIPNGAVLHKGAKEWGKLQAEGAMAGVADLFLMLPRGEFHGLWLEMKVGKNKQTETQKAFEKNAVRAGYAYAVPRSFAQFERIVKNYIKYGEFEAPR